MTVIFILFIFAAGNLCLPKKSVRDVIKMPIKLIANSENDKDRKREANRCINDSDILS